MSDEPSTVPVLIVGGGPAGLTASLLLSRLGIESLLLERRPGTSHLPKAHILNQRTMEIFSVCGVADEVYEQGSPIEFMSRVAWYTSLIGPTELHGREIARCDSWGGGPDAPAYAAASRLRSTNLPQMHLEPILRRHAEALAPGRLRFSHDVLELHQDDDGVTVTVEDREAGNRYDVRAQYVIGADGGRTVGHAIGAVLEGERDLVKMVSTHIKADIAALNPDPSCCIYWFINPESQGSIGSGALVKMGGRGWGVNTDEWVFGCATTPDDPQVFDAPHVVDRVRRAVGDPELEVEIIRISPWRVEALVADRYAKGRIFLAGDAAHRHPPTGGLGLNTAVQDVHNLAWKLAAVVKGEADPTLLETYETERRPVGQAIVAQSLSSFFQHAEIDQAVGIAPDAPATGWEALAELFSDSIEGEQKRAQVNAAATGKRAEFAAHNIEIGYRYEAGAIVPEGAPAQESDPCTFRPSARPGSRMPHAWVGSGVECVSTYEVVDPGRFTLFIGDEGSHWRDAAAKLRQTRRLGLDVVTIGARTGMEDRYGSWREQSQVRDDGAVLVRPDHHVAWRSQGAAADATAALMQALDTVFPAHTNVATV